jgi:non-ribosomal peptide synthetase-like protein
MSIQADTRTRQSAGDHRPVSRSWLDGRLLTCAGYGDEIRWRPGERLEQLFERRCDWFVRHGTAGHLAVDAGGERLSYLDLDARANRLARFLMRQGIRAGDRIGLLSDNAVDGYVGMLAVLKAHAAYVPLDIGFPADRLSYIVSDANVRMVLSRSHLAAHTQPLAAQASVLNLDEAQERIAAEQSDRPRLDLRHYPSDALCYVIYTSGSTGRPKGVAVGHASICNFVQVASEVYGIAADDRVYQGMTIAFDFSVEEIWVPWMAGATLVPKPGGGNLLGPELGAFLRNRGITAMCCVPTLLATLEEDLPGLRFLLVSGESCPQDLVARWSRPGRRFLNVYGPTEATVTASWTVLDPGRPVTIGVPLPTYSMLVLDPEKDQILPPGAMGEIAIAGIGVAYGYLNREDLTKRAFIPDFLGVPGNLSRRIYRTGDLGRINDQGEVEHHGRIDTQVKIRGYRIELTEIESVLMRIPGVAQAVVTTYQPSPDVTELAAYYSLRQDSSAVDMGRAYRFLREQLPPYMVPAYLEHLPVIPMMPSGKADRKSLPPPRGTRLQATSQGPGSQPASDMERTLAGILATVLGTDRVSVDGHFFNDLGASSLLMAKFNAALRERSSLPTVSMKDIYLHPTVRQLATMLTPAAGPPATPTGRPSAGPNELPGRALPWQRAYVMPDLPLPAGPPAKGKPLYALCGILQVLTFVAYVLAGAVALDEGTTWVEDAHGIADTYARLVAVGGGGMLLLGIVPIIAKWLLIGRWKPRRVRVWSMAYFRFWVVKTLVTANPVARLAVGTPLFNLYLRALGAKIGRGAVILTRHVPVCTDLLTIGAGSVIRRDTFISGYRARSGIIETGRVIVGNGAYVGEHSILEINTALGDRTQLGHASALRPGQIVPDDQIWHGSPAEPAPPGHVYRTVPPAHSGVLRRRIRFSLSRLLLLLAVTGPLEAAIASLLLSRPHGRLDLLLPGQLTLTSLAYYRDALVIGAAVVFGLTLIGLTIVGPLGRLLSRLLEPGRVYPLYGFHHSVHRTVGRLTNIKFFNALLGDSAAIVGYLGLLGYRLKPVEQTGSNFGMDVSHDIPTLSTVGTGTLVSDGLSLINTEFSATSFGVQPAVIGRQNFLGNGIAYPARGKTGDNVLLATKVMIPIAGPVREGVGLLGSPPFEIPRSVSRDRQFDELSDHERRRLLRAKTRHNLTTMALFLIVRCVYVTGLVLVALAPLRTGGLGTETLETAASVLADMIFTVVYFVLVDRAVTGFRALRPKFCSIYQRQFWRHERYWKVPSTLYIQFFNGTPFKGAIWRLLGVRCGRRLFDDGCTIVERSLTTIGSYCTLGAGSTVQGHSLEDGAFKSDYIHVGSGCTIGTIAFVHYGVTMGDGSALGADSFLMKGEIVPPGARWRGNPAIQITAPPDPRSQPAPVPQFSTFQPSPLSGRHATPVR